MDRRKPPLTSPSVLLLAGVLAVTGCETIIPAEVQEALQELAQRTYPAEPPYKIVGAAGNRMFFMKEPPVEWDPRRPGAATDLRALDLDTLENDVLLPGILAFPADVVTDGAIVAWEDRAEEEIRVHDLTSGTQTSYPFASDQTGYVQPLDVLAGNRLLLLEFRYPSTDGFPHGESEAALIVLALGPGERRPVATAFAGGARAVLGDFLVHSTQADRDISIAFESTLNLELVNLATNEQQTIARQIRTGPSADLAVAGDRYLWRQYKQGSFQSKIISFDPETGEKRTIANNLGDPSDDPSVFMWDANEDWMLLQTTTGRLLIGETVRLDLRSFDGKGMFVAEYSADLSRPWEFDGEDMARLVGDYVVWIDPFTATFMVFDPQAGTTREFDPSE